MRDWIGLWRGNGSIQYMLRGTIKGYYNIHVTSCMRGPGDDRPPFLFPFLFSFFFYFLLVPFRVESCFLTFFSSCVWLLITRPRWRLGVCHSHPYYHTRTSLLVQGRVGQRNSELFGTFFLLTFSFTKAYVGLRDYLPKRSQYMIEIQAPVIVKNGDIPPA